MTDERMIREAPGGIFDPELNRSLLELGMIRDIQMERLFPRHPLAGLEKVRHIVAVASGNRRDERRDCHAEG